jgi:hypothetical protein
MPVRKSAGPGGYPLGLGQFLGGAVGVDAQQVRSPYPGSSPRLCGFVRDTRCGRTNPHSR